MTEKAVRNLKILKTLFQPQLVSNIIACHKPPGVNFLKWNMANYFFYIFYIH